MRSASPARPEAVGCMRQQASPSLATSMASCSCLSNCGSSPCSPPSGGCAWLRSRRYATNLTRPARDCRRIGRSGRRNRRFVEPRNMDQHPKSTCRVDHEPDTVACPMVGETENASHTENPTLPSPPPLPLFVRGGCQMSDASMTEIDIVAGFDRYRSFAHQRPRMRKPFRAIAFGGSSVQDTVAAGSG